MKKLFNFFFIGTFLITLIVKPSYAENLPSNWKVLYVLNRLGYGPRLGDIERVEAMGIDQYINQQLSPESISDPPELTQKLNQLQTLGMTPAKLFLNYGPPSRRRGQKPDPEAIKTARKRAKIIMEEAVEARFIRAIESPKQFQEVMVDFWFNHFNVFAGKGLCHLWTGAFEEQAIRPYVLGRFRDLLGATAKHPAMLFYLDNWENTAPGKYGKQKKFRGLNENYARELMELHTVGVNGGYNQQDVIALAQIFTGWGLKKSSGNDNGFFFDAKRHDFSDKVFMGYTIRGEGIAEGEEALDILARSSSTARQISYQLAQYFISDDPDPLFVAQLSKKFLETDGNIRAVLELLFHSPQFWDEKNFNQKFKTPYQFVISSIRATGINVDNYNLLYGTLKQLGMPLYGCLTPDGYKNTQDAWLNPDGMLRRLSFVTTLANGNLKIAPMKIESQNTKLLTKTLGNSFSENTQKALKNSTTKLRSILILGSPEFMRH